MMSNRHRVATLPVYVAMLFVSSTLSSQDGIVVPNGFGTGLSFVEEGSDDYLNIHERTVYTRGFVNGLFAAGLLKADNKHIEALETCLTGMTDVQLRAILEKYIKENPKECHHGLPLIGMKALGDACNMFPIK
jgi:hypothetical protein